jgi:xanthine/CO dehydrogenase XdhC/CoxF family maturation factor
LDHEPDIEDETMSESPPSPNQRSSEAKDLPADDVLSAAARWQDEGLRVALATVVATWGSSPRPVGSQLAVDERGRMVGSVSGGCIEGAVVHEARGVMAGGGTKLLEYGVTDEMAWEVGLACGGTVRVYVEPLE